MGRLTLIVGLLWLSACFRANFDSVEQEESPEPDATPEQVIQWISDDSGLVDVSAPTVRWLTPESARIAWTRSGESADFVRAAVLIVPEDAATRGDESQIRTFDGSSNPELDYWELPETGGVDLVLEVTAAGLSPSTAYRFQVRALDNGGTWSHSEAGTFTTPAMPANEIVLFDDNETNGYSIPATMVRDSSAPNSGTHHWEYVFQCPAGAAKCFENLRRQGIGTDLSVIGPGAWDSAFLEMYVSTGGAETSWWSQFRLMLADGGGLFMFDAVTIPGSGSAYLKLQVPLTALTDGGLSMTYDDGLSGLHEWGVGASWLSNVPVRIDDVRIRY
ncbi:MAG: fibronectin type III domain-containing protein [Deltaproteobacteria bacterium]|nr:fibronectin type III domain-containing protein [Deltaproteobacteria bacterium]